MIQQTTIARPIVMRGPGLHTNRKATVTLRPAPAGHGRQVANGEASVPVSYKHWVPSVMSTSLDLGAGRRVRTIEHMMAAFAAHGVDNVAIEVDGPEIPILDGSARPWCAALHDAGLTTLDAPRRAIRIRRPVQIEHEGGFLRAEPATGFSIDVTHDVLPAFPVLRWRGAVAAACFDAELAASRSFGSAHRRFGLAQQDSGARPASYAPFAPNRPDRKLSSAQAHWPAMAARGTIDPKAPKLRGWRPWRATLILNSRILPWSRFADEPVRHVALDMIGDLALAGAPLIGRIVAHNPSHFKTCALTFALMEDPANWDWIEGEGA